MAVGPSAGLAGTQNYNYNSRLSYKSKQKQVFNPKTNKQL